MSGPGSFVQIRARHIIGRRIAIQQQRGGGSIAAVLKQNRIHLDSITAECHNPRCAANARPLVVLFWQAGFFGGRFMPMLIAEVAEPEVDSVPRLLTVADFDVMPDELPS